MSTENTQGSSIGDVVTQTVDAAVESGNAAAFNDETVAPEVAAQTPAPVVAEKSGIDRIPKRPKKDKPSPTNPDVPPSDEPPPIAAESKPTFQPNYKFKVMDEEKEFDEMFKGLVKDAESEKKIREFHEKAFGLDYQKPKYEKLKTEHSELSTKYNNIDESLKLLSSYVQNDDFGSFIEAANIPEIMVFRYVQKRLQAMQAPPEERQRMEEFERIRRERFDLERQNQDLKSRYESETVQAKIAELDMALARPDVSSVATAFDALKGKGAFRQAVIRTGQQTFHETGQQIPVAQAVQETLAYWSPFLPQITASTQQGQPQAIGNLEQTPQAPKPTLPNVSGRSTSPIKAGPRSIEDLHKISQQKFG